MTGGMVVKVYSPHDQSVPEDGGDVAPEVPGLSPEDYPRRWYLYRKSDHTGVSGTGIVAYGIQYPDGVVSYRWNTSPAMTYTADSIHDVAHVHGHGTKTDVRWIDE